MWMRLAALAAIAFVPCVYAQGTTPAAPLTLDDAIARVAQYHPDLRLAQAQRPVWEARRDAAGLSPPLTVGVELENALGSGDTRGFDAAEVTVTLAGVLERGGKLDARRAVAQANLDSLAPQRETARLDLMAEVARRYLAVTDARQQLRIAETDIEQRRRAVAAARLRLQAGASPESVLLTAQAMLAQAELDRDRAQQMDQSARASLSALWRQREPGFDVVTGDPMQLPALQDFAVLAEELQRTPELAVLAGERRIREAQVQLARTQARPDVSWQVGVRNSRDTRDTSLVAGFSLPLGSVRRADPEIRAAEAELALNSVERDARALQLYATLAEAHGRYLTSRLEVTRMARDVLPQLQRAENAAEKAWRAGAISYMEWAQLQAMRIDARQRQREAAIAAQTALIELQRLTGQSMVAATDTVSTEDRR
ncbi:TolC family protein [Stenotrophomonas rhizophila]|uniref:Cobalt-zinc-cadmium efflux system outer membrane protein n=1 Tax=Stenotrophomonas rhizophila TaxID=216778 RepID=A0A498CMI6_9GAMM|nr:TolC family protein [Stenotrophomonas rhizophila]KAB7631152.1 TolC family protein [Stenotrophomonas rhizophila]RLK57880.1 cobalt-zinc-cadmium efflux system outer membrane protein [Stenotrophomonas rhizophila]